MPPTCTDKQPDAYADQHAQAEKHEIRLLRGFDDIAELRRAAR